MINYDEAAKTTVHYLAENINNYEKVASLAIAGADQLAKLLCKTFVDLSCEHDPEMPLPTFIVFPAAFQIALEAFWEFSNNHAEDGFTEDTKRVCEEFLDISRRNGFLKQFAEAGRKAKNHER